MREVTPQRFWYLLPLIILAAGLVPGGVFLADGISGLREPLIRIVAPPTEEVHLPEGGAWTIFYEFRSTVDGRVYNLAQREPLLLVSLVSSDGERLVAGGAGNVNYNFGDSAGYSVGTVRIDGPGTYRVEVSNVEQEQIVLAFGHEKLESVGRMVAGAVLVGTTVFVALVAFGLIFFFRVRSKRRIEKESYAAGLPPPPGA